MPQDLLDAIESRHALVVPGDQFGQIAEVWESSPDVRLGQLMAHLRFLGEGHVGKGLGDIEDDEIVAVLYRHRAELEGRLKETDIDGESGI